MKRVLAVLTIIAAGILFYAGRLFFDYNHPIIKELPAVEGLTGLLLVILMILGVYELVGGKEVIISHWAAGLLLIVAAVVLIFAFLQSAVLDYFQPFSLYDDVIYLTLAGFLLLIIRLLVDGVRRLAGKEIGLAGVGVAVTALLFVGLIAAWAVLQTSFEYGNIVGDPVHLFEGGVNGYNSYRIPGILVIPAGSTLADGSVLAEDIVLVFAEARRDGSLDEGDIDLVMRRSDDGGMSWADPQVVREWHPGEGKIGNPTPVFDAKTGVLVLMHIAGDKRPYTTWVMESENGGMSFGVPTEVGEGIVGPGHGVQVMSGPNSGRLVTPAHFKGSSSSYYSDDHGKSWMPGGLVGEGNESEIAVRTDGSMLMVVRTNHPVSKPHGELTQLFAVSDDWGVNWGPAESHPVVKTPICMSSLVTDGAKAYLSSPDDYYSRALITVFSGSAGELDFSEKMLIYAGPAGYSDMGVLSDGGLLLLFENGAVEYDERITLVRVDN